MLKSDKILLRPLQLSDLDFLFEIENNKENWKYGAENKQYTKEELSNYIANAKQDIATAGQFRFVIDFRNTPIGFIDLFDYTTDRAGVGVIIAKNYRRRGFAKEALKLLSIYSFETLNFKKLDCNIEKDNLASIKLFTSCGFELEREKKELQYFVKLAEK
ncbi:GNAT family N-acetyltransferase [Flavobacteriales bacterium]|nr:GNAT family N-acetyltransferase [Flavobacteriales bacterium]